MRVESRMLRFDLSSADGDGGCVTGAGSAVDVRSRYRFHTSQSQLNILILRKCMTSMCEYQSRSWHSLKWWTSSRLITTKVESLTPTSFRSITTKKKTLITSCNEYLELASTMNKSPWMGRSGKYTLTTNWRTGQRYASSIESCAKRTEFIGSFNNPSNPLQKVTVRSWWRIQRTRSRTLNSATEHVEWMDEIT